MEELIPGVEAVAEVPLRVLRRMPELNMKS